uniref:Uncharacterized protein n=1 Tax=Triticum urartu TaxID=4572 RepID=A0A8R7PNM3_TRIUA
MQTPCPPTPTPRPTPLLPSTATVLTTPLSCQSNQMMESRSQTPPSTTTPTTLEVTTTTCQPLTTTRSSLGGSQAGGLRLFRSVSQFVLAFLRQTCLTYVCTQILLFPLTRL